MKSLDELFSAHPEKNRVESGTLYLTATPIGNTMDITARALRVLAGVSFIAAEDTRVTGRLLSFYGIEKPLLCYFEHNKHQRGPLICERLLGGESCALVTDAGMPAISDPGQDLVALCRERGIPVRCVPGCCAAPTALALSGMDSTRFAFEGFLPQDKKERAARLEALRREERTMLFYEAPHRLQKTLAQLYETFGEREIALCRELTKLNEQTLRLTLSAALALCEQTPPRGEYVLVVGGAQTKAAQAEAFWSGMRIAEHVKHYMEEDPTLRKNDALKLVAKDRGMPKAQVYRALLEEEAQ